VLCNIQTGNDWVLCYSGKENCRTGLFRENRLNYELDSP